MKQNLNDVKSFEPPQKKENKAKNQEKPKGNKNSSLIWYSFDFIVFQ